MSAEPLGEPLPVKWITTATGPAPVLGDLILAAIWATRDAQIECDAYTYGRKPDRTDLDAARAHEEATQRAVWSRLLDVAPQEYGK